ncbi:MAG TPA: FUSC family protein, partial [Actinomycetota bacterium]|nr:FUSC family protein [Actinomycetota bacterium]
RKGDSAESVLDGLDAGVELRLLAHVTLAVAVDAAVVAGHAAEDAPLPLPHWRAPRGGAGPWLGRVGATFRTHLSPSTVWFRNSLRAALALGLAILAARTVRVDHSFWVVLGTLSVLRSNALATGRTALLAILGTVAGFIVAAGLTLAVGTSRAGLWIALPVTVFLAAYVPTAVSFLIGQAAFTLYVIVLFDLLQPQGWRLGLVRMEDVLLGAAVSLVVAVLLWPRGARGQLRSALATLYRADAACLAAAFGYLLGDRTEPEVDASRRAARIEVARAGEAFDEFLTERGSRTLATVTWGRIAAAGDDLLLAVDAMEVMSLLGYRTDGCEDCVGRVRRDVDAVVGVFAGFADELEAARQPPGPRVEAAAATRDAVLQCLRAWGGAPGSPLDRTAIGLAAASFWSVEIARIGGELAEPLRSVAVAASSPWWR